MNEGFSLMEFMVAMTITLMLLTLIVSQASLLGQRSARIMDSQERLEALFNTVDFFKSDISSCGMRLQEAQTLLPSLCCETAPRKLTIRLGTASEVLSKAVAANSQYLDLAAPDAFADGKTVLVYDPESSLFEWNRIRKRTQERLTLENRLQNDYPSGSRVIVVKSVTYQHDPSRQLLSRKVDRAPAQPMLEQVKDFYFTFYPQQASMLYQLELSTGEQVRGYITLNNLIRQ